MRSRRDVPTALLCMCLLASVGLIAPPIATAASRVLVVPSAYRSIQAAVDAAHAGDTIRILPGTYVEQVTIAKDLTLLGSGAFKTTVRAPTTLVPGLVEDTSIIEIHGGAAVKISNIAVSGPGAGHCGDGELTAGIHVVEGSRLDLSYARILHIRNTPLDDCFHSGVGVLADDFSSGTRVNVDHSEIADFGSDGIVVVGDEASATVRFNVITGQGRSTVTSTGGVGLVFATGTVSNNIISGNACGGPDLGCGPDWFGEFQVTGISGGALGLVIANNLLFDNQVGIYVTDQADVRNNVLWNNDYFGIAVQDGSFTLRSNLIQGGEGGVAVIAATADTEVRLNGVRITHTQGAKVQLFECCGFTASAP